jgi:hypothetical protein
VAGLEYYGNLKDKEPSSIKLGTIGHFDPPSKIAPHWHDYAFPEDFGTQLDRHCLRRGDVGQVNADLVQHLSAVANVEEITRHQCFPGKRSVLVHRQMNSTGDRRDQVALPDGPLALSGTQDSQFRFELARPLRNIPNDC